MPFFFTNPKVLLGLAALLFLCFYSDAPSLPQEHGQDQRVLNSITVTIVAFIVLTWFKWSVQLVIFLIVVVLFLLTSPRTFVGNKIVQEMLKDIWEHRMLDDSQSVINNIQQEYNCCGYYGPTDYRPHELPSSCCTNFSCKYAKDIFDKGCAEVFKKLHLKN